MSLLTIIQNVSDDINVPSPTTVIGNTDPQITQLLRLANREGRDLASRFGWRGLLKQQSFTGTTGTRDQGVMDGTVVSGSDFDYIINDTFWNQTLTEPVHGPLTPIEIENVLAFPVTGPYERWWILGKNLYIDPAPTTADTYQFQYKSKHWCESSGGTGQSEWAADDDVGKLDEDLMELGLIWRWLRRKGMDYTEEFNTYEKRVADAMARDGGKKRLDLSKDSMGRVPGIFVPAGSWNV